MTALQFAGWLLIAYSFGYMVGHVRGMIFVNKELAARKSGSKV